METFLGSRGACWTNAAKEDIDSIEMCPWTLDKIRTRDVHGKEQNIRRHGPNKNTRSQNFAIPGSVHLAEGHKPRNGTVRLFGTLHEKIRQVSRR